MRYLKTYENILEPEAGDYVICTCHHKGIIFDSLNKFLKDRIGRIVVKLKDSYLIHYDDVSEFVRIRHFVDEYGETVPDYREDEKKYLRVNRNQIVEFSKSKKYLKGLLLGKKYNL